MAQSQDGDATQMGRVHRLVAVECRKGASRAQHGQFTAEPIGAERDAEARRIFEGGGRHLDIRQPGPGFGEHGAEVGVLAGPLPHEGGAVGIELVATHDDLDAGGNVGGCADLHREAEAVEKLRTKLPLFRIAAADQNESRRMTNAEPLSLDDIFAGGRDIEQKVDDVILEQIHLVDIEKAAMSPRQQPRLEPGLAGHESAFEIERTGHAILGGAERQVDDRNRSGPLAQRPLQQRFRAGFAMGCRFGGIAAVEAVDRHLHGGKYGGQGADGGRLAGSAIAEHQHPADSGIDGRQRQGQLHLVLGDDGRKGKCSAHGAKTRGTPAAAPGLPYAVNDRIAVPDRPWPRSHVPAPFRRAKPLARRNQHRSEFVTQASKAPPQGGGGHDKAHPTVETAKTESLKRDTIEAREAMTTNQGVKISDDQNSEKAGIRGGSLLEDFLLREKITAFDHERIPERVVHARGAGAHGVFEAYEDLSHLTMASPFSAKGKTTPVFTRFSTVAGSRGSADTPRDVRGFAVKFYSDTGIWDLVGNDIPVFFINDAIKFPDLIHAVKPEPHIEIPQAASAHDTFWDFASLSPETSHMLMWVMSDRGLPRSFANMEGFGVHTWRFVNAKGESCFVKFHWKPIKGVQSQVWDEAQKTAGKDPDYQRRDMFEAIERGDFLEWELGIQVIEEKDEFAFDFDLLDDTKLIPEELVPLRIVGKMTLNRNPDNYFAETEQVAFCVSHVVPGIDFTNDPMLQGRLFSYLDTQLRRIGPNFAELPINRPLNPVSNNRRDGFAKNTIHKGRVSYFPSALAGVHPMHQPEAVDAFRSYAEKVDGHKIRARSKSFTDYFTQATMFYNSLADWEKQHIVEAFSFELNQCETKAVPKAVMANILVNIDADLAAQVAEKTGLDIEECKRVAPKPVVTATAETRDMPKGRLKVSASPALSMDKVTKGIKGRRIAVLAGEGVDGTQLDALRSGLEAKGAIIEIIAAHGGTITCSLGKTVKVDRPAVNAPSVIYDAVAVPGGASAAKLAKTGLALAFVAEAFKHGKPLVFLGDGAELIAKAHLPVPAKGAAEQGVTVGDATAALTALVTGLEKHRYHNRDIEAVAA